MRGIFLLPFVIVALASCDRNLEYSPPPKSTLDNGATSKQAYFGMPPSFQFSRDVVIQPRDAGQGGDMGEEVIIVIPDF